MTSEAKNLVDGSPETTWTSAGDPASELDPSSVEHTLWFSFRNSEDEDSDDEEEFGEEDEEEAAHSYQPVELQRLQSLSLTFQGGYSAISATLSAKSGQGWVRLAQVWPEDGNATQTFQYVCLSGAESCHP